MNELNVYPCYTSLTWIRGCLRFADYKKPYIAPIKIIRDSIMCVDTRLRWNYQLFCTCFKQGAYLLQIRTLMINRSNHHLLTEYALRIRNKFMKAKCYDRNALHRPRVSGVQSRVLRSKGLYACVTVPIYLQCPSLTNRNERTTGNELSC